MLFIHNNKYLPLTGLYLLCCSELYIIHREMFEIFHEIFEGKKIHITTFIYFIYLFIYPRRRSFSAQQVKRITQNLCQCKQRLKCVSNSNNF